MAEKNPTLNAAQAEFILEDTALALPAGSLTVAGPSGLITFTWGADATGSGLADAPAALAAGLPDLLLSSSGSSKGKKK